MTEVPWDEYDSHALKSNCKENAEYELNGQDFNLYSTFEDALAETNPWQKIHQKSNKGMPGELGSTEPDKANITGPISKEVGEEKTLPCTSWQIHREPRPSLVR